MDILDDFRDPHNTFFECVRFLAKSSMMKRIVKIPALRKPYHSIQAGFSQEQQKQRIFGVVKLNPAFVEYSWVALPFVFIKINL